MKILVVGNYFYPEHTGGVEIVSHNLVKYFRELGCYVRWMAADVPPRFRETGSDDVPILSWNFAEEKLGFPSPLPHVVELVKIIDGVKWSDVVHLQDCLYPTNIIVFFASKLLQKPVLITQYAKFIPYKQYYKRFLQLIAYQTIGRLMFAYADHVVFITKNVMDSMRYLNPKKMNEVVPLGVDTDLYSPLVAEERNRVRERLTGNSTTPIILFVGRMVERKGVDLLKPLVEKHQEWRWVFVGRPDDYNPAEWGYQNLTYFQNAPESLLRELYASSDLLVHPSVGEGVTLIVSESLSSGTPVLLTEESLYEVDEKNRKLFFPIQPTTVEIENALIRAFSDDQCFEDLRRACREFALSRLSWKIMTEQYLGILADLLE